MRVLLLSGLARARALVGESERSAVLRDEAIAIARRMDYRPGLSVVLMRSYWARGSNTHDEVLEMLAEARTIAEELGDIESQAEASEWRITALIGKGDLRTAGRELAEVLEISRRMHQPFIIHVAEHYRSAIALCEGRLAEAEQAAERSREWSRLLTGRDASGVYGVQMFGIRREQGRLAELAPVVRVLAGGDRRGGSWRPGLAALTAELGMLDEARAQLALIQSDGLDVYRHALWVGSLTYIADACVAVGDADLSEQVYRELLSIAERNVMIGHGVACYGSSERYLGTLAAAYGELELAELHLQRAIDYNRDMGAITWLAHSDFEYARTLGRRAGRTNRPHRRRWRRRPTWPSGSGCRRCSAASAGCCRPGRGRRGCRTACPGGRPRSCAWSRRAGRTGRSAARCISASTRLQTTYAAFCVRPVARTAPKRQAMRTRAA